MPALSPTSAPMPPPFPVGSRLRYRGTREVRSGPGPDAPLILGPGLEVEIVRVEPGRRGTGLQLVDSDGPMVDDDGEPIVDRTEHGRSIYEIADASGRRRGRIIRPADAGDWEAIGDYGPYRVGDFVQEGLTFCGIVVGAGPKRFRVQWENTTRNEYAQDYQGIRRASWSDPAWGEKQRARLRAEVRPWSKR